MPSSPKNETQSLISNNNSNNDYQTSNTTGQERLRAPASNQPADSAAGHSNNSSQQATPRSNFSDYYNRNDTDAVSTHTDTTENPQEKPCYVTAYYKTLGLLFLAGSATFLTNAAIALKNTPENNTTEKVFNGLNTVSGTGFTIASIGHLCFPDPKTQKQARLSTYLFLASLALLTATTSYQLHENNDSTSIKEILAGSALFTSINMVRSYCTYNAIEKNNIAFFTTLVALGACITFALPAIHTDETDPGATVVDSIATAPAAFFTAANMLEIVRTGYQYYQEKAASKDATEENQPPIVTDAGINYGGYSG